MNADPWAPEPVPDKLPHKPYTLPAIGTDPYPGRENPDHQNSFAAKFERDHGLLYEVSQRDRVTNWAKTVAAYEDNPRRFALAWNYLNTHPIFYRFRYTAAEHTDYSQVVQERYLRHDIGMYELIFGVSIWCSRGCEEEDCTHPERDVCWAESGPWTWPGDPDAESELPAPGQYSGHDHRLDVYGNTFEECIIALAHNVWTLFGNDRELDHTANT